VERFDEQDRLYQAPLIPTLCPILKMARV
jgi:hypothetical protein